MATAKNLPDGLIQRGNVYWADFRAGGRRIRKSLSRNLKTAKQLLIELRARAERGEFGLLDNDYPVAELREQFLRHCRQTLKAASVLRYEDSLNNILPAIPPRISQISPEAVLTHREQRLAKGIDPGTVNYDVAALGRMLRWGMSNRLISHNPLTGIKPLPKDDTCEGRALTREEVDRLKEVSSPHWRDIWHCYLVTGLRNQELANLMFSDIDWDYRELVVQSGVAKSRKQRRIPIEDGLWEIFEQQSNERETRKPGRNCSPKLTPLVQARFTQDHVFVTPQNSRLTGTNAIYDAFMRGCRLADIPTRTFDAEGRATKRVDVHSLRRTFATELIITGSDPKTVQELLGHKTLDITMRLYAKVHTGTKRQAIGRLTYGHGIQAPEHVVEFPQEAKNGHSPENGGQGVVVKCCKFTPCVTTVRIPRRS